MDHKNHAFLLFLVWFVVITLVLGGNQAMADSPPTSGAAGISGNPTSDQTKTELGRYKARFYAAVGSHWYMKVGQRMQLLDVDTVDIQYTIYADGTITTKVLNAGTRHANPNLGLLLTLSVDSIKDCSPFIPFTDSLRKQIGDSYTDDFKFSITGAFPADIIQLDKTESLKDAGVLKLGVKIYPDKSTPSTNSPASSPVPRASQID